MCLPVGNCQNISEDMNEDTISVLVRLITEKKGMWPAKVRAAPQNSKDIPYGPHDLGQKNKIKHKPCGQHRKCILSCQQLRLNTCVSENAAALEELLLEYESKQMAMNKGSSIKYVAHTNDHLPVAFLIFFFFLLFLG